MQRHHPGPLVSIITPFLNAAPFIGECIESVLAQTYSNWELMLVDDGSGDGSDAIARRYAAEHPDRIFYLTHEGRSNRGASASRNLGISQSRGSFIAFLDADDVYLPQKLERQVPQLIAQPEAGMLYSATEYWYSWSSEPERPDWIWEGFAVPANTLAAPGTLLIAYLRNGSTVPCMGSVLARREAIDAVGGWEDEFQYIYTDQVFHAKMSLRWPVYVASGCWDRYRQHPDSAWHKVERTNKAFAARQFYLKWLGQYLRDRGFDRHPDLAKAFVRAQLPYLNTLTFRIMAVKNRLFGR